MKLIADNTQKLPPKHPKDLEDPIDEWASLRETFLGKRWHYPKS